MNHEELKTAASDALSAVFGDTSVSRSATRTSLRELRGEIDMMLEALDDDGDDSSLD